MNNKGMGFDAIILTASKVISISITMLITIMMSRYFTLAEYGLYSQLNIAVTLVASIFTLGLPSSFTYFIAGNKDVYNRKQFASIYFILNSAIGVVMGAVLVALLDCISNYFNNENILNYKFFILIFPWCYVTTSCIENVLVAYQKTRTLFMYRILFSLCQLFLITITVGFRFAFNSFLVLYLVIYIVFSGVVYALVFKEENGFLLKVDFLFLSKMLKFSIPIGVSAIIGTLDVEIDKLLIGNMLGTEQLAVYTNASKELPVGFVVSSISVVALPKIISNIKSDDKTNAIFLWRKSICLGFIFLCFISTGVFFFAKEVIQILYSSKYISGVTIFRIYCLVTMSRVTYFGMMLNACGKTNRIMLWSGVGLFTNIILNFILYHLIGILGPALATAISVIVTNFGQLVSSSKLLKIRMSRLFPWRELLNLFLYNLLLGIIFYYIRNLICAQLQINRIIISVLISVIWGFVYLTTKKKEIKSLIILLNSMGKENNCDG